jgi:RHS repeat-associated protein
VGFAYDAASRRTTLTLANGITVSYGYDNASQVTSIAYRDSASTLLGDLTYGYDLAGRRTSMGGSFARTGLPAALASATYDANNRLTNWGGAALSHDANGNLLGFQGKTYAWNSRDQLASISGAASASFAYDAVGRREGRTISGTGRQFLYDGLNPVQERSGGSVSANILTGLGIDEFFKRTEGTNVEHYLTDALGSTLRLTDGSAAKLVDYSYEPYGETSADASSGNAFQYTGRENDGTGLYYDRARYYDPVLKRFISEDPIGLLGGINLYSYVGGNPITKIDPSGLADIFYNNITGTVTIVSVGGAEASFPAANNAQLTSNGPFPAGTFPYSYPVPHSGAGPDTAFGSYGGYYFSVPGRPGMGVHSGRSSLCDLAGRCGVQFATDGCIRTTDAATQAIQNLINSGDPIQSITVIR